MPPIDMEEIIEKKPSHPTATILLVVSALALLGSTILLGAELRYYVNPQTRASIEAGERPLDQVKDWLETGVNDEVAAERGREGGGPARP